MGAGVKRKTQTQQILSFKSNLKYYAVYSSEPEFLLIWIVGYCVIPAVVFKCLREAVKRHHVHRHSAHDDINQL